jgi:hypothetical protein
MTQAAESSPPTTARQAGDDVSGIGLAPAEAFPVGGALLREPPGGTRRLHDLGVVVAAPAQVQRLHARAAPGNVCVAPRAVVAPNGDLLVIHLAGSGFWERERKLNEMVQYRSTDGGDTWSGPEVAWSPPYSVHAAGLVVSQTSGELLAIGTEYDPDLRDGYENGPIALRSSTDSGHSWSPPRILEPVNDPSYRGIAAMPVCQLEDGTLLVSTHKETWRGEFDWASGMGTRQFLLRSEDGGRSWELLPDASPNGWFAQGHERMDEAWPVDLGGGRVLMLARTPEGHLWELRSDDSGRSWSPPAPTSLVHPDAPPMVTRLRSGTLVALHHNRHTGGHFNHDDRAQLWLSTSDDDGRTWSEPRFLLANAAIPFEIYAHEPPKLIATVSQASYADLRELGDTLHVFIDHQMRQILHLRIPLAALSALPTARDLAVDQR